MSRNEVELHDFFDTASLASVVAADNKLRRASVGPVLRPETFDTRTGKPERSGLFCQKLFGPVVDFRCACGKYAGREHEGTVCEKCGVRVETSAARNTRFAHIELAVPVLHPAAFLMVAEYLGVTTEELRMLLRHEVELRDGEICVPESQDDEVLARGEEPLADYEWSGLEAVRDALQDVPDAGSFFVDLVPVLPPGEREPVLDAGDPRMLHPVDGSVNSAYSKLIMRANRHRRLIELQAPPIILSNELRAVQRLVEELIDAVPPGNQPGGWVRLADDSEVPIQPPDASTLEMYEEYIAPCLGGLLSMIWLDESRLAVASGRQLRIVGLDGELEREIEIVPWPIRAFCAQRYLVFADQLYEAEETRIGGVQILDTSTWELLDVVPAGVGLYALVNGEPEDLFLFDIRHRREVPIMMAGDRPGVGAYSRDGVFGVALDDMEGGVVIELPTALPLANLARLNPDERFGAFILRDGRCVDASALDDQLAEARTIEARVRHGELDATARQAALERLNQAYLDFDDEFGVYPDELYQVEGAAAIALTSENRWRYLTAVGTVGENEDVWFRVTFDYRAAAFSPGAHHLALWLEAEDEIMILELPDGPVKTVRLG